MYHTYENRNPRINQNCESKQSKHDPVHHVLEKETVHMKNNMKIKIVVTIMYVGVIEYIVSTITINSIISYIMHSYI